MNSSRFYNEVVKNKGAQSDKDMDKRKEQRKTKAGEITPKACNSNKNRGAEKAEYGNGQQGRSETGRHTY